jgi:tRNA 2-thiouridine synthesizing protein B
MPNNLHTINKAPSHCALYEEMLASVSTNTDALLLIEDASYLVQHNEQHASLLARLLTAFTQISVLRTEIEARGLTPNPAVTVIDYPDFVELSASTAKTVAWF